MSRHRSILFVDDDQKLLSGVSRLLAFDYDIETALGGEEALKLLNVKGACAIIVSDMRMPGMDGIELLERISKQYPETVRIMLTGNVDQATAVNAANTGRVFRFLNKPVDEQDLRKTLDDGLQQYSLVTAKKEILEKTLSGTMRILTDILGMTDPVSYGRAQRVRDLAREFSQKNPTPDSWQIEIAAMLGIIGLVAVPAPIAIKIRVGTALSASESAIVNSVPQFSHDLLMKIPHLEGVAEIILHQNTRYDGSNGQLEGPKRDELPWGSRVLKVLIDLQMLIEEGMDAATALSTLQRRPGMYDPYVLEDVIHSFGVSEILADPTSCISVSARCLRIGQVLASDVLTLDGSLILAAGTVLSPVAYERLKYHVKMEQVQEPITVFDRAA